MRGILIILVLFVALQGAGQEKITLNKESIMGEWLRYVPDGVVDTITEKIGFTWTFKLNGKCISKMKSTPFQTRTLDGVYKINKEENTIQIKQRVKDSRPVPDFSSWKKRTFELKVVKITDDEMEVIYHLDSPIQVTRYYKRIKN